MIGLSKIFHRRRPEVRDSYTDLVVSRLVAASAGVGDGGALAAVETASRIWGSGLASATVKPSEIELAAVTPSVLDTIGRALCRSGESLHVIDVRDGRVTLTPTALWTVQGDADPASWMYLCTLNGPSTARTITRPPRPFYMSNMRRILRAPGPDDHQFNWPWIRRERQDY